MCKRKWIVGILASTTCWLGSAQASEYGCTVLMCLANPNGPKAAPYCVPFIDRLYDDLREGRPFPSCDDANKNNQGGTFAQQVNDPYDPCPEPLQPAAKNSHVLQGAPLPGKPGIGSTRYTVADHPQISEPNNSVNQSGQRACISKLIGSYHEGNRDDGYTVSIFDKVVWQKEQSPRAIDVFMNKKFHRRIHW